MRRRDLVLEFLGKFVVVYVVLIWPWRGLAEGFARYFRGFVTFLFNPFGVDGVVAFRPHTGLNDATLFVCRADSQLPGDAYGSCGSFFTSTRYLGYLAMALMVALVLASPISWKRRIIGLLRGLVAVHALVAMKVLIIILLMLNMNPALRLSVLDASWTPTLNAIYDHFVIPLGPMFSLVVLSWIAICFRRGDIDAILGKQAEPGAASGPPRAFASREDMSAGDG